jgi:hypothetical protein
VPAHSFTAEEAAPLVHFANERHAVYLRKALLNYETIPDWANPANIRDVEDSIVCEQADTGWYTHDTILGTYRFCNVFRELDRVTVWIRENIREPYADSEHLWFMLAIARFINWPPTLQWLIDCKTAWPDTSYFAPSSMTAVMEGIRAKGEKVETGAYMIRAESDPKKRWYSWSKQRYVAEIVLGRPWRDRKVAETFFAQQRTLQETWEALVGPADWVGWGPFMAGQVVADLRHTRYLSGAPDVGKWAPVGPGSARGINRLAGRPPKQSLGQAQGLDEMLQLQSLVNAATAPHVPWIELHDIQNCLCETDKYLRVQTGEGKPRAAYVPGRGY